MEILKYLYENPPKLGKFINRKINILKPKTILSGGFNSGKTYLAISFLNQFKNGEFLYINLKDTLLYGNTNISENINIFLSKNQAIKAIIIDNISQEMAKSVKNIDIDFIILITNFNDLKINGFDNINLLPLDFEEFIAFNNKKVDINSIFAEFLQIGNGVKNLFSNDVNYKSSMITHNFIHNEIIILKECSNLINQTFSTNKIYHLVREKIPISKDKIYEIIDIFEKKNVVKFIHKFQSLRLKKIYFYNFDIKDVLSTKKDFHAKFTNALLCEILKLNEEIFFLDFADFYIPKLNMAIIVAPFSEIDFVFLKFKKIIDDLKKYKITKLNIISMANSGKIEIDGIKCEIIPFWQFALSF